MEESLNYSLLTAEIQSAIGFDFKNEALLLEALTHSTYLNEVPDHPIPHNERLEFLGDAVMDFIVGDYLFNHLPQAREGLLTDLRAAMVRAEGLALFAQQINLGHYILMGKGEEVDGGRTRISLLADAFEALVAAMYLDQGLDAVREWVERLVVPMTERLIKYGGHKDAKTYLQEKVQELRGGTPYYKVISKTGPDHAHHYIVEVCLEEEVLGKGEGSSNKAATQVAAQVALEALGIDYEPLLHEREQIKAPPPITVKRQSKKTSQKPRSRRRRGKRRKRQGARGKG